MSTSFQPKNLLVTGGAGFIGSNFIHYYLSHMSAGKIVNLDKLTYAGSLKHLEHLSHPERYHFIKGDICDHKLINEILKTYNIDTIVHFAAESHVDRSIDDPAAFIETNISGTFTLLEAATDFWLKQNHWDNLDCRFHHVSTDEVYGSLCATDPPFTESSPYAPNSPYAASKASADHLVRAYAHTYHLPVTLSQCSNNYGPRQHPEKFIPTIIQSCLALKPIPVYGDGSNRRDWLHVNDHCAGILAILLAGTPGDTYNIGACNEKSNIEIARLICQQMDTIFPEKSSHESLIEFVPDRPGHDWRYAINAQKITKELLWQPREDFDTGIYNTILFYLRNSPTPLKDTVHPSLVMTIEEET